MRYIYKERIRDQDEWNKKKEVLFHGEETATYSGQFQSTKGNHFYKPNNFESANYALMIYDKKQEAFRLVPVQRHLHFEQQKEKREAPPANKNFHEIKPGASKYKQLQKPKKSGTGFMKHLIGRCKSNKPILPSKKKTPAFKGKSKKS